MGKSIPPNKQMSCSGCGKDIWKSRTSRPEGVARCRDCQASHGTDGRYKRGCRCDVCREGNATRGRRYRAARASEGRPLHGGRSRVAAICDICGDSFMARKDLRRAGKGRFCSRACLSKSRLDPDSERGRRRERERVYGRAGSVRYRALRRARAALEMSGGNRVFVQGPCAVCGDIFTAIGGKYCSDRCKGRSSRRRFGMNFPQRVSLYKRDDWKCHLCGLPVMRKWNDYDPCMPTLDHLVPRAHGGADDAGNLLTAHSLCNSIRRELPVEMFRSEVAVDELRSRIYAASRSHDEAFNSC